MEKDPKTERDILTALGLLPCVGPNAYPMSNQGKALLGEASILSLYQSYCHRRNFWFGSRSNLRIVSRKACIMVSEKSDRIVAIGLESKGLSRITLQNAMGPDIAIPRERWSAETPRPWEGPFTIDFDQASKMQVLQDLIRVQGPVVPVIAAVCLRTFGGITTLFKGQAEEVVTSAQARRKDNFATCFKTSSERTYEVLVHLPKLNMISYVPLSLVAILTPDEVKLPSATICMENSVIAQGFRALRETFVPTNTTIRLLKTMVDNIYVQQLSGACLQVLLPLMLQTFRSIIITIVSRYAEYYHGHSIPLMATATTAKFQSQTFSMFTRQRMTGVYVMGPNVDQERLLTSYLNRTDQPLAEVLNPWITFAFGGDMTDNALCEGITAFQIPIPIISSVPVPPQATPSHVPPARVAPAHGHPAHADPTHQDVPLEDEDSLPRDDDERDDSEIIHGLTGIVRLPESETPPS